MSNSNNTFLGIIAGTAIGATLGILFAPDKGANTRNRIASEAQHMKHQIGKEVSNAQSTISSTLSSKKENLDTKIESLVSDASYKAEDVITSLERKLSELKLRNKKLQKTS